jgi:hypothetical protein
LGVEIKAQQHDIGFLKSNGPKSVGTILLFSDHCQPRPTFDQHTKTGADRGVISYEQDPGEFLALAHDFNRIGIFAHEWMKGQDCGKRAAVI